MQLKKRKTKHKNKKLDQPYDRYWPTCSAATSSATHVKNWWTHLRVMKPPVKVVNCWTPAWSENDLVLLLQRCCDGSTLSCFPINNSTRTVSRISVVHTRKRQCTAATPLTGSSTDSFGLSRGGATSQANNYRW